MTSISPPGSGNGKGKVIRRVDFTRKRRAFPFTKLGAITRVRFDQGERYVAAGLNLPCLEALRRDLGANLLQNVRIRINDKEMLIAADHREIEKLIENINKHSQIRFRLPTIGEADVINAFHKDWLVDNLVGSDIHGFLAKDKYGVYSIFFAGTEEESAVGVVLIEDR
jgi:hypothetical protein